MVKATEIINKLHLVVMQFLIFQLLCSKSVFLELLQLLFFFLRFEIK